MIFIVKPFLKRIEIYMVPRIALENPVMAISFVFDFVFVCDRGDWYPCAFGAYDGHHYARCV
jgi:hypothetical protein